MNRPRTSAPSEGQMWMDSSATVHCAKCGKKGMVHPRVIYANGYACKCDKCGGHTAPTPAGLKICNAQ